MGYTDATAVLALVLMLLSGGNPSNNIAYLKLIDCGNGFTRRVV
jgi:hypothetical protein